MTPGEFREVVKVMKEFGLSKLKMGDLEISMQNNSPVQHKQSYREPNSLPPPSPLTGETESDPVQHKVEQLNSLLKLSDTELVDHLFPEPTEEESA